MLKLSTLVGPTRLAFRISQRALASAPEMVKWELVGEQKNVALVTLNRPKALNAICEQMMNELISLFANLDEDKRVSAIVLTGNEMAFAAGADLKENKDRKFHDNFRSNFLNDWNKISEVRKPVIAAVNGFALGGGCELALLCDIIYAGDKAQFGQPEIKVGTVPGGTQRLSRTAGKSITMELCLSGERMGAAEAQQAGVVSKVFPASEVVGEAVKLGEKIAAQSPLIVQMAKEAVNVAYETTLREGLRFERRLFHSSFATKDRKEGMTAFAEKREPKWQNE